MEMELLLLKQVIVLGLCLLFFSTLWRYSTKGIKNGPPEVPGRWPLIGHLHTLGGNQQPLVRTLGALADKYGPLITVWIGVHPTVVVNSSEMAKECYTASDKHLATRPLTAAGKFLGYDYAVLAFTQYGPYWREVRKIATLHLLSARQLDLLNHVRVGEVDLSIKDLYKRWNENKQVPVKVDLEGWFGDLVFNNVVMAVASKRYSGTNASGDEILASRFRKLMNDFSAQGGDPIPSDAIPILEWFDVGGKIGAMKKTFKELDSICSIWLKEHQRRRLSGMHGTDRDFFDVMLTNKFQNHEYDADTITKATCLSLVLAGTDTSSITLTWALSLLLNNRHALKKVQEELVTFVGKDRNVIEEDIPNLPYLQAIIKETMRLYPPAPLAVPHEAIEDCSIGGFRVPAGTRVLMNLWKIQRDPRLWTEPNKFLPERFLTSNSDIDLRGQHFELIPFGSGRRVCPGMSFALKVVHLTLARLLHSFDVGTPFGELVDMTETPGLSIPKATPLEVLLSPRLPSNLYL
ncbi:xanthotoxin 5-hydroxylase CYP82C4-like [Aristolochia californica]|uniref:xanthotoxin 5-hydroxylase CYP82C4-like n=1 Tax=Aristolochia californica TaxID=171875 RepID=UPI0035E0155E